MMTNSIKKKNINIFGLNMCVSIRINVICIMSKTILLLISILYIFLENLDVPQTAAILNNQPFDKF